MNLFFFNLLVFQWCYLLSLIIHRLFVQFALFRFFSYDHIVQTLLHLIHVFMGYILMLIVMTYNVYLLLAVVFGFSFGYFLFAHDRALLLRSGSCCHWIQYTAYTVPLWWKPQSFFYLLIRSQIVDFSLYSFHQMDFVLIVKVLLIKNYCPVVICLSCERY